MRQQPSNPFCAAIVVGLLGLGTGFSLRAQTPDSPSTSPNRNPAAAQAPGTNIAEVVSRIREEGLNRSEAMSTLSHLTDVIGPRLTGSPNLKRANQWTRDQLASWGLADAHLEAWGPFGRGWSLQRFSAQIVEPQNIPLAGYPKAWSPGLSQPLVGEVLYFEVSTNADLEKYRGKLKGAIVLTGPVREIRPRFESLAVRLSETNLLQLANAGETRSFAARSGPPGGTNSLRLAGMVERGTRSSAAADDETMAPTNALGSAAPPGGRRLAAFQRGRSQTRYLSFLANEGAALIVNPSSSGDGGTFLVAAASVPTPESRAASAPTNLPRAWSTNAPAIPPQITLAAEDYNRLVRMVQKGERLMMAVDLQVQFHDQDLMAYNTIAEIPGTDLKDEIVMLGAHIDSWHSGTGATDDGAGVAATMEAVRILTALKLQPRRTIRIGLWSGEEQGLLGSKAYVARHLGYYTNAPAAGAVRAPKDEVRQQTGGRRSPANSPPTRRLVRRGEYEEFSAYFNLDNGAGKIRGVYLQGNEAVRPLFRRWLAPFRDLGAETISLSDTSGTDHISFDSIGLPGFQFIQDPLDYWSRTHHFNEDVMDRVPPDDLKQASVILAVFAYQAAMLDERLPRKPTAAD